jgi:TPR repeat protein
MYKYDLATRYFYGISGFEQNYKKAKYWLEQCLTVKEDFPEALYLSGLMFSDGLGCNQDSKRADNYFSKMQSTYSLDNLPYFTGLAFDISFALFCKYVDGVGVPYNYEKSTFWSDYFNELCEKSYYLTFGQKKQRKIIARRFKTGDGVPFDKERAGRYE